MNKHIKKILAIGCLLGIAVFFVGVKISYAELPKENTNIDIENSSIDTSYQLNVDIPGLKGEVNLPNYIKAVYRFGIGALAILAMGMIMIGGYQYMFSAGDNITSVGEAKKRIKNALIGLFIALTSFLLLNTINPDLLEPAPELTAADKIEKMNIPKVQTAGQYCNKDIGPDCKIGLFCEIFPGAPIGLCSNQQSSGTVGQGSGDRAEGRNCATAKDCQAGLACKKNTCVKETEIPKECPSGTTKGTDYLCYQAQSIANQYTTSASAPLKSFLTCMNDKLPSNVGVISSLSDDNITNGTCTIWSSGTYTSNCQHDANSCHYGGSNCSGKSYAVDYADQQNNTQIKNAASACSASGYYPEDNHIHVSVGKSAGCSCDTNLSKP